jgi:hypothetical protein
LGNYVAGIQGSQGLQGATGATGATNVTLSDDTTTNATRYLLFDDITTGSVDSVNVSSTKLTFNPSTGNLTCAGTVTANSDEKIKENIKTIEGALNKVCELRGVEFDYKQNNQHSLGFIAQEVEKVIPHLVFGDDPKSVAYQNFVALLVEAIKELKYEVEILKNTINNNK